MRWLHIYLSMFGLAAVLFFSITGVTLNHPDWFFGNAERRVEAEGQMDPTWLHRPSPSGSDSSDSTARVEKLEVVEHLRKSHRISGSVAEFRADDSECLVTFKGPGYSADAVIDVTTGRYTVSQQFHGFTAIINDLHKGRDTGFAWSILIDVSAVLMTVISLTGLVLLFYLKLRRIPGLIVTAIGTVAVVAVYLLWVP